MTVFGVNLTDLMTSHEREKGRDVPSFVEKAINFIITYGWLQRNYSNLVLTHSVSLALNTEGIFRLSGKLSEIQEIRDTLDMGKDFEFVAGIDHHVVCGLLKMWFREMPGWLTPIICYISLADLIYRTGHPLQSVQQLLESKRVAKLANESFVPSPASPTVAKVVFSLFTL